MRCTHSAVFCEVKVDEDFGTVRVTRVVSAVAAGRIINPQTARSQIIGGVVWGISQALHEETHADHALGRFMNHNLSEYHVAVNADIETSTVISSRRRPARSRWRKGVAESESWAWPPRWQRHLQAPAGACAARRCHPTR